MQYKQIDVSVPSDHKIAQKETDKYFEIEVQSMWKMKIIGSTGLISKTTFPEFRKQFY